MRASDRKNTLTPCLTVLVNLMNHRRPAPPSCVIAVVALSMPALISGCGDEVTPTKPSEAPQFELMSADELKATLDETLDRIFLRRLDANVHAAWQIVHGVLAFGPEYEILVDGKPTPCLEYLLSGGEIAGWEFRPTSQGLRAIMMPGTKDGQGHIDQWLGYLSHCRLPPNQPIVVRGREFTLEDLIRQTQLDIQPGQEACWTLMGLAPYLAPDATWTASDGEKWNLERVVGMEAAAPLASAACGGSHQLYGLAMALDGYRRNGGPEELQGPWLAAQSKIDQSVAYAEQYQLPSGAFSASYFSRQADSTELDKHLGSTGHTLEFLCAVLDDQQIKEEWVQRGAQFLCRVFDALKNEEIECGALFHAAHGLHLYRVRRFGPKSYAHLTAAAEKEAAAQESHEQGGGELDDAPAAPPPPPEG